MTGSEAGRERINEGTHRGKDQEFSSYLVMSINSIFKFDVLNGFCFI